MMNILLLASLFGAIELSPLVFVRGGWGLDQQAQEEVGSPYLIAHGCGVPVDDASASFVCEAGEYRVWVRTRDWADGSPGRFRISIDNRMLEHEFGRTGSAWHWEDGGLIALGKGRHELAARDLTGFDGRFAGVLLSEPSAKAPEGPVRLGDGTVVETGDYDLVVVGGGPAGTAAAIAAARRGVRVALLNDRGVLGGNSSSELRVQSCGEIRHPIVREIANEFRNRHPRAGEAGERRLLTVLGEKTLALKTWHRAIGVTKDGELITSVRALDLANNRLVAFRAPLFVDATGDGWIGYWAGADYRMGREGRDETGEKLAPEKGDRDVLGASIMWTSREERHVVAFSAPWAEPHARGIAAVQGEWNWECGLHRDMTTEVESIRDHMLCVIYGSFSLAKRKEANARRVIDFCPYLLAKRESRRLLGDHILTGEEIAMAVPFEDAVATGSWSIDLHYDDVRPGVDFLTRCDQRGVRPYWIPYRSLYSRSVSNLFMAGRCLSATHVGLGSPRVMNTLAQTGVAVGEAAAICGREGILPRGIWSEKRIVELQNAIGGDWPGRPAPEHADWAFVDDEDEGVVFNGKGWIDRDGVNGGVMGFHARGYDCRLTPPGTAVYPLPVKEPGCYRLRFRVPYRLQRERTSIVSAYVESAGSSTKVSWDTSIRSGEWNPIGEFDLVPGAKLVLLPSESTGEFMTDAYSVEKIK